MTVIIIDTETTGKKNSIPIEIAYAEIAIDRLEMHVENRTLPKLQDPFLQRYAPGVPIELGAMATHHIKDEDLKGFNSIESFVFPKDVEYIVGHNVDFDWEALRKPNVRRICTLALSRWVWPSLDSHTLSALMYHTHRSRAKEILRNAHSALADIDICYWVLMAMWPTIRTHLETQGSLPLTWDRVWGLSEQARIPKVMPFGKHYGEPISTLPHSYKSWLLKQSDVDPYLIKALNSQ